ncbi:hypothetical protein GCM10010156_26370 [Planobispora rosea]|uniref:TIGR04222 domain-containing membrane protein n=1 Tax=Planobispora rosea TaxID=35762 RepID=A0A8J3S0X9_PLARO|nr:TIGR04222 domain-containing membrane protein [Planobispora rosea]GGS66109.1 hypothetical protein GCM10010156_26370 [Planobispora rosea]GIH84998.1 hypothetical protein Pro02_34060 [Planobispora rosea]
MDIVLVVIAVILLVVVTTTATAVSTEYRRVRNAAAGHRGGPLSPYELAYLAGGPLRTINTALGMLARGGGIRVARGGQLSLIAGAPPSPDPIEQAVLDALAARSGTCPAGELRRTVADSAAMNGLRYRLLSMGLLVPDGALAGAQNRLSRLLTVSVLAVLFTVGTLVIGLSSGLAVVAMLGGALSALIGLLSYRRQKRALRDALSKAGHDVLNSARLVHVRGARPVTGDLAFAVGAPVALYGLGELGDPALSAELERRDQATSSVGGSCGGGSGGSGDGLSYGSGDFGSGGWGGDSGGGSGGDSGGGGSSCGGGGGCGGGCGGG